MDRGVHSSVGLAGLYFKITFAGPLNGGKRPVFSPVEIASHTLVHWGRCLVRVD